MIMESIYFDLLYLELENTCVILEHDPRSSFIVRLERVHCAAFSSRCRIHLDLATPPVTHTYLRFDRIPPYLLAYTDNFCKLYKI